jgi:hypothetical protein
MNNTPLRLEGPRLGRGERRCRRARRQGAQGSGGGYNGPVASLAPPCRAGTASLREAPTGGTVDAKPELGAARRADARADRRDVERGAWGARPEPPSLYSITKGSRDHTAARYRGVLLPALAAMDPPPKARVVEFGAGVHGYMKPEPNLPKGIGPAVAKLWNEAITQGYYVTG